MSKCSASIRTLPRPHEHATFLRRERLVQTIYNKLIRSDVSSVVLTGIKGVGKSTLAAQVYNYAEAQRSKELGPFAAKTLWLTLGATVTLEDLLACITDLMELPAREQGYYQTKDAFGPQRNLALEFHALLQPPYPPRLIILDQFEEWQDDQNCQRWLTLLNGYSSSSRVLLTAHTYPQGEDSYRQIYLQEQPIGGLQPYEGATLLRLWDVPGDEEDLLRVVKQCQGHPLALELFTGIQQKLGLNIATLLNSPEYKHLWKRDIKKALLTHIYDRQLKNSGERQLLQAFSIYREPVPWQATYAILNSQKPLSNNRVLEALSTIQGYHLVQLYSKDKAYYELHPLVKDFVVELLENDGDTTMLDKNKAHEAAAQYYLNQYTRRSLSNKADLKTNDVHPLIEAIWHYCQAERRQEAYDLLVDEHLFTTLQRRGNNSVLLELYTLLLPSEGWQPATSVAAQIYNEIGEIYSRLGHKHTANTYFTQALEKYRACGIQAGQVRALNNLGTISRITDQNEQALQYYQQAEELQAGMPEPVGRGITLTNRGKVLERLGQLAQQTVQSNDYYQQALICYQQALAIGRAANDVEEIARTLNNLGEIYGHLQQPEKAQDYYQQALQKFRAIGERQGECIVGNNLGVLARKQGRIHESIEYYTQALKIAREIEDRWEEGTILRNIGRLSLLQSKTDLALACFLLAQNIYQELGYPERGVIPQSIQSIVAGKRDFSFLLDGIRPDAREIVNKALTTG